MAGERKEGDSVVVGEDGVIVEGSGSMGTGTDAAGVVGGSLFEGEEGGRDSTM